MSHFTVMVIGDDAEKQLAPYHEYECTGNDDEYVIDIDCTEEVESWLKEIVFVGANKQTGESDWHFSETQAAKKLDNYEPMSRLKWIEAMEDSSLDQEIDDWFGYKKNAEGHYFKHTNPNSKWDWYQVGGRWSGFFRVKNQAEGQLGEKSWANADEDITPEYADVTTKGNVDIVAMMEEVRTAREKDFDQLVDAIGDCTPVSWTALRKQFNAEGKTINEAREAYSATEFDKTIKAYNKKHDTQIGGILSNIFDDFYLHLPLNQARIRYVETAALNCVTPYAFVKDGHWVERGEMGWWGMASNEKDQDEWTKQFYKMFSELPDDTLLTMVDCHI